MLLKVSINSTQLDSIDGTFPFAMLLGWDMFEYAFYVRAMRAG